MSRAVATTRKLTDAQVLAIRASKEPQSVLSAAYGISQPLVSRIRTGKKYRSVANPEEMVA